MLNPCPFCGQGDPGTEAEVLPNDGPGQWTPRQEFWVAVRCWSCRAQGPRVRGAPCAKGDPQRANLNAAKAAAAAAWDRREVAP